VTVKKGAIQPVAIDGFDHAPGFPQKWMRRAQRIFPEALVAGPFYGSPDKQVVRAKVDELIQRTVARIFDQTRRTKPNTGCSDDLALVSGEKAAVIRVQLVCFLDLFEAGICVNLLTLGLPPPAENLPIRCQIFLSCRFGYLDAVPYGGSDVSLSIIVKLLEQHLCA
jgi:hypothetical protein